MTWGYLGKANTYSDREGKNIFISLSGDMIAKDYINAITDIVRTEPVNEIVIGDEAFSVEHREVVSEILSLTKSLRLQTVIMTKGNASTEEIQSMKPLFDIEYTNIVFSTNARSFNKKALDALVANKPAQKNILGYVIVETAQQADMVFKAFAKCGVKDVVTDITAVADIKQIAASHNIKLHQDQEFDIVINHDVMHKALAA